ncbi:Hypothetical protein UVM_LOCUS344 [uncultured virus]|nr:Hypothetical protein UVM_LOCUS344 [uncultured virus]
MPSISSSYLYADASSAVVEPVVPQLEQATALWHVMTTVPPFSWLYAALYRLFVVFVFVPAFWLWFHGPSLWGFGFYAGTPIADICHKITTVDAAYWLSTPEHHVQCQAIAMRQFESMLTGACIGVYAAVMMVFSWRILNFMVASGGYASRAIARLLRAAATACSRRGTGGPSSSTPPTFSPPKSTPSRRSSEVGAAVVSLLRMALRCSPKRTAQTAQTVSASPTSPRTSGEHEFVQRSRHLRKLLLDSPEREAPDALLRPPSPDG